MLLLNNMKARLTATYLQYANKGAAVFFWGLATMLTFVFGVVLIGISVFTDTLMSGPALAVATPSTDDSALGIVEITPTRLDADGTRIAWGIGSALVVFGLGLVVSTAASLVARERQESIFGSEADLSARGRLGAGIALALIGGLVRVFLESRVASAAGIETVVVEEDTQLFDWLYAVPWQAGLLLIYVFAWVWERGKALQDEVDHVV